MQSINLICSVLLIANLYLFNGSECIMHGELVKDLKKFPYVVAIEPEFGKLATDCTGSIIDEDKILTAAHCVLTTQNNVDTFATKIRIRAHTRKTKKNMESIDREAVRFYLPKSYIEHKKDDIAIIQVSKGFKLNSGLNKFKLKKVSLPPVGVTTDNVEAVIAGFGKNERVSEGVFRADGKLRSLEVKIRHRDEKCESFSGFKDLYLCVAPRTFSDEVYPRPGGGDSGGAVVVKNGKEFQILGVLSRSNMKLRRPAIATRVDKFLDSFIYPVINGNIDPTTIHEGTLPSASSCPNPNAIPILND